jgi:hypothetical protein
MLCTVAVMSSQMPSPPCPDPRSPVPKVIVTAGEAIRSGEATMEQAILHAAVHGWYEGHIQGEDACPGLQLPRRAAQAGRQGLV